MAEIRTAHLFTLTPGRCRHANDRRDAAGERRVGGGDRRQRSRASGMRGTVLKGGRRLDRRCVRTATTLDVRLVLETDDGRAIGMTYRGLRHGPAEVIAKVNRGEPVDPGSVLFPHRRRSSRHRRGEISTG